MSNIELKMLDGITPQDLGFGPEFPRFRTDERDGRQVQLEAIEFAGYCEKRFAAASIPTGIGKTLIAMSVAKVTGLRTCILTATKGLQEQYSNIMGKYGAVDIRGRANYRCQDPRLQSWDMNCKEGATAGCGCIRGGRDGVCGYERAKQKAKNADIVVTNYAYWMNVNDHAVGLSRSAEEAQWAGENPIELLILDEADTAQDMLSGYLGVTIYEPEVKRWVNEPKGLGDDWDVWKGIADQAVRDLKSEVKEIEDGLKQKRKIPSKTDIERLHKAEKLLEKFTRIGRAETSEWTLERKEGSKWGRTWQADVVWPGRYAEKYLFCGIGKVLVMSATLRPKTMGLLGVGSEKYEFREWPRIFPANRHQIYNIPARNRLGMEVRVDRRTSDDDFVSWVEHIDRIISGRLDRKGIIQTVSYDRQKYLMEHSRHSGIMLGNTADKDSDSAVEVAERFRRSEAPKILVSPSFARGWDFPMSECEYVIICKVPFKPTQSKAAKAREAKDPQFSSYMAMQEMVQGAGRGMRSAEDRCEVFACDGHMGWFLGKNKGLAPEWFAAAVRKIGEIPKAPPRLTS